MVASADGDVLILDNKKINKPLQVYNFSVDKTPSYFAGISKLWVHNAKCDLDDFPKGTTPLAKNDKGEWTDPITGKKINITPIPESEVKNFTYYTARPVALKPGTTIYRVYGGKAGKDGPYWTMEPPTSKNAWREGYAVLDEWNNDANKIVKYTVKEGDNIGGWVGTAAPQTSKVGEVLGGGKEQIFIDVRGKDLQSIDLPSNWEG